MEQFWNYFGFVGIVIMMLTFVVMICEFVDRDKVAIALNQPGLSDQDGFDFWLPAHFVYKHRKVRILARACMAISVMLMLVVAAGPMYDLTHQDLRAPFAYLMALVYVTILVYLWMQAIRVIRFLLLMFFYFLLWIAEWVFGTEFLTD
ncbi:MAG: hypothetical protein IJ738_03205 [Alphaproteobacteria bacterium]|nr:hypothetical protein [Alphaproteobacteria bacterium]